jgi:hypothetical protein
MTCNEEKSHLRRETFFKSPHTVELLQQNEKYLKNHNWGIIKANYYLNPFNNMPHAIQFLIKFLKSNYYNE